MRNDKKIIRPLNRRSFGIGDTLRREWRWFVIATLTTTLAAFVYVTLTTPRYPIRETIGLQHNALTPELAVRQLAAAEFGVRLLDEAFTTNTLRSALRDLPGSHFAVAGSGDEAFGALRKDLFAVVNPVTDEIAIGLNTPFPHQGASIVHAVADSLMKIGKAETADAAGGRPAMAIDPSLVIRRQPASADLDPIGLSPILLLPLAVLGGLTLGMGIAIYRQNFHRRVRFPQQFEREIGVHGAGYLPRVSHKLSQAARCLAAHTDPGSDVAMQCRSLVLQMFKANDLHGSRSILVTSPAGRDGRTTVAMNLAATLALMDEKVLIVDANLHSPALHKLFGLADASLGFCEALDNPAAALDFIRHTHVDNLHFLSCGKQSSAAAAKLQGRSFVALLAKLRERYRHVIFDGGALLGSPDMTAVAAKCNSTLLVCHARRTSTRRARAAAVALKQFGVIDVHAIVNDLPTTWGQTYFGNVRPTYKPSPAGSPAKSHGEIYDYGLTAL